MYVARLNARAACILSRSVTLLTDAPRALWHFNKPRLGRARFASITMGRSLSSMPLSPYMKEGVFDPKAIDAMNTAFMAVCKSLQLPSRDNLTTQIIARKIIEIANTGEHDPQRIHDLTLIALKESDQLSA
jgi:hypothetical protein